MILIFSQTKQVKKKSFTGKKLKKNFFSKIFKFFQWGRRKRLGIRLGVHRKSLIDQQISLENFKSDK